MSLIPLLLMAILALALYGLYFKLAAVVFKRTRLSWGNSFLFALLMLFVLLGTRAIPWVTSNHLPEAASSAVGLLAGLLLGSWFFGTRARRSDGQTLGWAGGFALTLIGFALLIATGLALILVVQVLRNP